MRDQLTLLRETDWDHLIVLDACRADAFSQVAAALPPAGGDWSLETVRAPGVCTEQWVRAVLPLLLERDVFYASCNPVVDREVTRLNGSNGCPLEIWPLWRSHWGRFGLERIPSVHPWAAVGAVLGYLDYDARCRRRRWVVHLLQPRSPYIGSVPLNMGRNGGGGEGLMGAWGGLPRPDHAVAAGEIDWPLVRRAYRANLELAWPAARFLARRLGGRVVVTSDHGELLGEAVRKGAPGAFGHEAGWRHPKLYEVPWLVVARGTHSAGSGQAPNPGPRTGGMAAKLEALGYA